MKKTLFDYWPIFLYLTAYFIVINIVVLLRFWQFEAYYFDHGLFDSAIWSVAHFQIPYIDHHFTNGPLIQLGDHFTPSIYLLSPMYWFTSSYEALLIVNNIFVVLSALVIFLIAKNHLKNKLMILAILMSYTLFVGMQNAVIANFHTEIPALFTLALTFYFMDKKQWGKFWIFLIITIGFKENFAALVFCLGLYLLVTKKIKIGLNVMFFSVFYYYLSTKIFIPYFAHHPYYYSFSFTSFLPIAMISKFFLPEIKSATLFTTFVTFGFLPLINFSFLPLILQDYFLRFVLDGAPSRIDLGLHYNAIPSLLMAVAAIYIVARLAKKQAYKKLINLHALAIIFLILFFHYKLHGAFGLAFNPAFYAHTKNLNFLREFVAKIPKDKKLVMTQNNLASYLTHDTNVMLLRLNYQHFMPDVIAIDIREGQSANNYWPLPPQQFRELNEALEKDVHYTKTSVTKNQIYYVKK